MKRLEIFQRTFPWSVLGTLMVPEGNDSVERQFEAFSKSCELKCWSLLVQMGRIAFLLGECAVWNCRGLC